MKRNQGYQWVTKLQAPQAFNTPDNTVEVVLVDPLDWVSAAGSERMTMRRLRGSFRINYPDVGIVGAVSPGGTLWLMIYVASTEATANVPNLVVNYTDEDVLWNTQIGFPAVSPANPAISINVPFDVKAQRVLKNSQEVRLSFILDINAAAVGNAAYTFISRALMATTAA